MKKCKKMRYIVICCFIVILMAIIVAISKNEEPKQEVSISAEISRQEKSIVTTSIIKPKFSDSDIELIAQAVEHEIGYSESYFPDNDFSEIQNHMICVILNRLENPAFPNTVWGVLFEGSGHLFENSDEVAFKPNESTISAVKKMIDVGPVYLDLFEMSFTSSNISLNQKVMEEQVGEVHTITNYVAADGRHLMFAASSEF